MVTWSVVTLMHDQRSIWPTADPDGRLPVMVDEDSVESMNSISDGNVQGGRYPPILS